MRGRNVAIVALSFVVLLAMAQEARKRIHVRAMLDRSLSLMDPLWYSPRALGDGGPAERLRLFDPMGIVRASSGDLWISDRGRGKGGRIIWRIDGEGRAHLVAGTGRFGVPEAGAQARASDLSAPEGLALGPDGRLHFADARSHRIFRIEHDGSLTVVAGTARRGFSGDGGPADQAMLHGPSDIRFDTHGNLFIADIYNHRVRRVTPDGVIETVAGTGEPGFSGDGGPATDAQLDQPWGVFIDPFSGRLLIADSNNHRIREVDELGRIRTVVGAGVAGYGGDGGPARSAVMDSPQSLGFDCEGRMYIGDEHNHVIRVVDPDGTIRTLVGTGKPGLAPDGAVGTEAPLNDPENMAVFCDGTVHVTDGDNGRVLSVDPSGVVRNLVGRARVDL
jgi:sugar lactone lactonase YvrE